MPKNRENVERTVSSEHMKKRVAEQGHHPYPLFGTETRGTFLVTHSVRLVSAKGQTDRCREDPPIPGCAGE
jgi:hypothetical protein